MKRRLWAAAASTLLAAVVLGGCATEPVVETGPVEPDLSAFEIEVGDCVNDGNSNTSVVPEVVDCADPHDKEAYLSVVLEDGPFPGDDVIATTAVQECRAGFGAFAGIAHDASTTLDFSWYYPSTETWEIGDREILCMIHGLDAERTPVTTIGTLEGANR